MATEAQLQKRKDKLEKATAIMRGASGEPIIDQENYRVSLSIAFNWYNSNEELKKIRSYGKDYIKKNKLDVYAASFNDAPDHEVRQISILMRLIARGQYVSEKDTKMIIDKLETFKTKYSQVKQDVKVEDKTVTPTQPLTVLDRIVETARKHAAEFDYEIDKFVINKASEFSPKAYLLQNNISGAVSKKIGEMYKRLVDELKEAIDGKDEQLNEGYSHFTKAQLKKFLAFVEGIVAECEQQVVKAKTQRAPRVRKAKPPTVLVKNLKYMKEFTELKLKSVLPTEIIGAGEVWIYNTKTRKLTIYKGDPDLTVRGTSILNFSTSGSETKMLRKPEEFFKLDIGKRNLNTAFNAIKTKASTPNGRVNEDCIIVGAFK